MDNIKDFISNNWKWLLAVFIVILLILGAAKLRANSKNSAEPETPVSSAIQTPTGTANPSSSSNGVDSRLMGLQPTLEKQFGKAPEGFIWDRNGKLLSLGYPDMSSEDVTFGFLRSLSTLDTGMAQRLSRGSSVISTYEGYFDVNRSQALSQDDIFKRESFKTAMLSLEVKGIENSAVFADNKRVYTVNARIVDFTDITFWENDKKNLFEKLYTYDVVQRDYTRAETYVNTYVSEFYTSEKAPKRDVNFSLTVEKYPDISSGWLVSIDTDLKNQLTNTTGVSSRTKSVNEYILEQYRLYKTDRIKSESK